MGLFVRMCLLGLVALVASATAGRALDTRTDLFAHYAETGVSADLAGQPFAASQRFRCQGLSASGVLLEPGDVVLTARHVVPGLTARADDGGGPTLPRCVFEVTDGRTAVEYPVDLSSAQYPTRSQRSTVDRFDWVVVKLTRKVADVKPYSIAQTPLAMETPVVVVTAWQDDVSVATDHPRYFTPCRVRRVAEIDADRAAGYKTDCATSNGASGAGLLVRSPDGAGWSVAAVLSSRAGKPSCTYHARRCYAYAIALGPEIRAAIERLQRASFASGPLTTP